MSLAAVEGDGEQIELRSLQSQLETTQILVTTLSQQLMELKDQVLNVRITAIVFLRADTYLFNNIQKNNRLFF